MGHIVRCVHCKGRVAWEGETPVCGPDEPAPEPRRNWRLVRTGILPLIVGLPPLFLGCLNLLQAWQSRSWPGTPGMILSASAQASPDSSSIPQGRSGVHIDDTQAAKIRYSYEVAGTKFENDCVRFGQVYSSSRLIGTAQATVRRHPPGPGTVYFDPDRPERSVLEPGFSCDVFLMPGISAVFAGAGFYLVFKGLRKSIPVP